MTDLSRAIADYTKSGRLSDIRDWVHELEALLDDWEYIERTKPHDYVNVAYPHDPMGTYRMKENLKPSGFRRV
jgi:hypothetical protein